MKQNVHRLTHSHVHIILGSVYYSDGSSVTLHWHIEAKYLYKEWQRNLSTIKYFAINKTNGNKSNSNK